MELNIEKIEQAVIEQAVDSVLDDGHIQESVKTQVSARIDKIFSQTCEQQIHSAIEEAIKTGFEREYVKVDSFGRQIGNSTSLGAELDRMVQSYWNQKVDVHGKPASGYGEKMTRAEFVMGQIMISDFNGIIKQMIVNAGGTLKDALRDSLYGSVNEALSSVLKVQSSGDQGLPRTGSSCIDPKVSGK